MSVRSWIRRDGLLHLETCALIVVLFSAIVPVWVASVVAFLAGIGKELWDLEHGGVASWHDLICDCMGIAVGIGLVMLI